MTNTINGVNYEVIRRDTKKGQSLLAGANYRRLNSIYEAYGRPSRMKCEIFDEWKGVAGKMDGAKDYGICSHNGFHFSVAWDTPTATFHITKSHNYMIV